MTIEENVNVGSTQTETLAMAREGEKETPQNNSAVLGKFKDVDALARAYEALQAEFTRRSQKLRVLEKEVENFKRLAGGAGAEKLRKTAKARREAAKEFDAFVAEVDGRATEEEPTVFEVPMVEMNAVLDATPTPIKEGGAEVEIVAEADEFDGRTAKKGAEEEAKKAANAEESRTSAEPAGVAAEGSAANGEEKALSSEALFQKAVKDEEVRLRIVGEYLASLGKSGAPLTGSKAGVLAAPPRKAKTVGQAGDMALLYFRKSVSD